MKLQLNFWGIPGVEAPPPAGAGGTTCDVKDGSVIDNDGGGWWGNGVTPEPTGLYPLPIFKFGKVSEVVMVPYLLVDQNLADRHLAN